MPSATDRLPILIESARDFAPSLIDNELARITSSRSFRRSPRHQTLLRHLVRQAVAGNVGALKEPVLALEVFNRPIDAFDPSRDTIVRVEARRLRQRLERYYVDEGRDATIEIFLPVGSYVPVLRRREDAGEADSRQARDLVERGEYFLRLPLSQENLELAVARFDAAVRASPRHVPAFVGLGRAWFNLAAGWYSDPAVAAENAAEALRRAVSIDENNAVAHALLGAMLHQFEYDWPAAQQAFERALALAPHQAFVHSAYGYHLVVRGSFDIAERELAVARRLDPHYVNARIHMVNLRIAQGRLDHAEAELDAMRDVAPDSMPAVGLAGLLALIRGDAQAALRHYQRVCELAPDHANAHASLAAAQGYSGQVEAADATIEAMHARFGARCVSPYVLAIVATRCNRIAQAFELIEAAIIARDPNVMMLGADPSFVALHAHPEWFALLASLKPRPS
ncbi:MAG: tetratricopeptide repeat protein [Casimicrobiaceae bacterium]